MGELRGQRRERESSQEEDETVFRRKRRMHKCRRNKAWLILCSLLEKCCFICWFYLCNTGLVPRNHEERVLIFDFEDIAY